MKQLIENRAKSRIIGKKRGWIFTADSFSDLGSNDSIRKALSLLTTKNFIKRIAWGIYYYPIIDKRFGIIPPELNLVAKTIAEKDKIRLQASGAHAANLIGLSEQVPAKVIFLTDGASKKIKIGKRIIIFKKVSPKNNERSWNSSKTFSSGTSLHGQRSNGR